MNKGPVVGWPSLVSTELLQEVEENICSDRLPTYVKWELHKMIPEVCMTMSHETVKTKLSYNKLSAVWDRLLTYEHKKKMDGFRDHVSHLLCRGRR